MAARVRMIRLSWTICAHEQLLRECVCGAHCWPGTDSGALCDSGRPHFNKARLAMKTPVSVRPRRSLVRPTAEWLYPSMLMRNRYKRNLPGQRAGDRQGGGQ